MPPKRPSPHALRVSELSQSVETAFALRPDRAAMDEMARALDLSGLRKLSFEGTVTPLGQSDWQLTAHLGATVIQPCVVTLDPVTTRIDTEITRRFTADYAEPQETEIEMPEDETVEPLGAWIDPAAVMQEALALNVPDYPRKETAELGQIVHAEPGTTPMTDDDAKPFAGLAGLRQKLANDDD